MKSRTPVVAFLVALLPSLAIGSANCRFNPLKRPLCFLSCKAGFGKCKGGMQKVPSKDVPPTSWTMVRLHDDGEQSYWGTETFPFTSGGEIGRMTDRIPCEGVWLRWTAGSYNYKWHNAPRRQLIASLNGHVEARVGSGGATCKGEKRRFGPGELLLAEDTKGRGHCTKSLDGVGRWSVFIALPEPFLSFKWVWAKPTTRECVLLVLLAMVAVVRVYRRWSSAK